MGIIKGKIHSLEISTDGGESFDPVTPQTITGHMLRMNDLLKLRDFVAGVHFMGHTLQAGRDTSLPRFAFATSGDHEVRFGVDAWAVFCKWCEKDPSILLGAQMP